MRANTENKSVDIEIRDVNYILPHYIAQYLYESKNEDPEKIIFPMFPSVPHPRKPGVQIPIEYIPTTDPAAVEIAEDGKDIPEVTPEQEAVLDEKDKQVEKLKESIESLPKALEGGPTVSDVLEPKEPEKPEAKPLAKASMERIKKAADREPKQPPGGDIGPGHPDGLGSRDARLDKKIASDLREEPEVDESKEKPADIEKPPEK